jgi:hypothetical protein
MRRWIVLAGVLLLGCGVGSSQVMMVPEGAPILADAKQDSTACDSSALSAADYYRQFVMKEFHPEYAHLSKGDSTDPPIPAAWSTDTRSWSADLDLIADRTYVFHYVESWVGSAPGSRPTICAAHGK